MRLYLSHKANNSLTTVNLEVLKDIENTNSVSIHVRMGDYKSSENADRHFVIRDAKYYERAIERIKKSVDNPPRLKAKPPLRPFVY